MRPDERRSEHRRLQELTRQSVLRLINSELNLAVTMISLAETEAELGDDAHGRGLLQKVEQALESVRHHMQNDRISDDERQEILQRLRRTEKDLAAVKRSVLAEARSARQKAEA